MSAIATAARLPILMYHSLDTSGSVVSVAPDTFAAQMRWLAEAGIRGMTLRAAVEHRERHGAWPPGAAAITFDDGYANVMAHALPVLARHGFTATVFLVSHHLGGANDWAPPPPRLPSAPIMSVAQARELIAAGMEVGAHTRTHADLRRLAGDDLEAEVAGCKADLEAAVGAHVDSFAYPFGFRSAVAVAAARRTFRSACTTVLRRAGNEPVHELPRVDMYYVRTLVTLEGLVRGRLDGYLTARRWARALRAAAGIGCG
ncbi:polysaccharide deacetylase family protein [Candidatus Binatia bacterium]|nr:polysaccharide deacetylase family protein [Candidatus Binatia bacterium]